jgi:phosphatidylglycerophosphate synthase
MKLRLLIPQIITTIRLVCAPLIFFTILQKYDMISITLLVIICITDVLDGKIARKFNVTTTFGAYYDTVTDFAVIIFAFSGFIFLKIYPYWLLIIFTIMFLLFIITSKTNKIIYDPFGKIYGALLILFVGITIILPYNETYTTIIIAIIIITIISFISRFYHLKNIKKR